MPVGGAEDFALGAFPHLAPEVNARFVCLRNFDVLGEEARRAGLPVVLLPLFPTKRISPVGFYRLSRWFRREGIQVVHTQTYHAHVFGVAAARLAGIPVILHQQKTLGKLPLRKRLLFGWCVRRAARVLTLSEQTRREMIETFGLDPKKSAVVPNAIDDKVFRPAPDPAEIRRRLGLPADGLLIGTVASLHPVKNHKTLIEALALTRETSAVFVGDGPARSDLEALARERGVTDRVHFAGRQRPVAPWFQALDAFVLPSVWEGQALAMLQAISCGLPIIASRIEGNTAVLGDSHPGLFDPHDVQHLAALLETFRDPAARSPFLADPATVRVPTCREAAAQLKAVYRSVAP